jgi:WD40 repeat protein
MAIPFSSFVPILGHAECIRRLDGHQGFVKGVCWDPVGEYLATQSDDKTVKIWRSTDWGLEVTVSKPFQSSPGSAFFNRLRWDIMHRAIHNKTLTHVFHPAGLPMLPTYALLMQWITMVLYSWLRS